MSALRRLLRRDPGFPWLLGAIHDPPTQLYLRGDAPMEILSRPAVAVVGARACSSYGRSVTRSLTRELASAGLVVVSGMARGVDGEAHRGALEVGGPTVAVLGCGIHRDYPAAHAELARRICETGGFVVSEYEAGVEPAPWRSPPGTGSSRVSVEPQWWWGRGSGAVRSSRPTSRSRRAAMCSPSPGRSRAPCRTGRKLLLGLGELPQRKEEARRLPQSSLAPKYGSSVLSPRGRFF